MPAYKGPLHIFTYNYIFHEPGSNAFIIITFYKPMRKKEMIFEIK